MIKNKIYIFFLSLFVTGTCMAMETANADDIELTQFKNSVQKQINDLTLLDKDIAALKTTKKETLPSKVTDIAKRLQVMKEERKKIRTAVFRNNALTALLPPLVVQEELLLEKMQNNWQSIKEKAID